MAATMMATDRPPVPVEYRDIDVDHFDAAPEDRQAALALGAERDRPTCAGG
jgi:hypothetical protein